MWLYMFIELKSLKLWNWKSFFKNLRLQDKHYLYFILERSCDYKLSVIETPPSPNFKRSEGLRKKTLFIKQFLVQNEVHNLDSKDNFSNKVNKNICQNSKNFRKQNKNETERLSCGAFIHSFQSFGDIQQ